MFVDYSLLKLRLCAIDECIFIGKQLIFMCGIVGLYTKHSNLVETLLDGLKKLEYRGYDSSGLALVGKTEVFALKTVGRIDKLEAELRQKTIPTDCLVGIAHTRWATHGVPSTTNAHPHQSQDGSIWVVHNGIIENYKELRDELQSAGVVFASQTDTEVIAHLISRYYQQDLKKAVLQALKRLRGAFAIAVVCSHEPDRLIGAKYGSPLVLGLGKEEFILASDVSAIISRTRRVVYLDDGDLVDIHNDTYSIEDFEESVLHRNIENVDWDAETVSKGGYEHFLLKEIMEQPKAILDSCRGRLVEATGEIKFGGLLDIQDRLDKITRVVFLGIGSTYYACQLGAMYFEAIAKIPAKAEMSPEFRYKEPFVDDRTWVIAMSQSGETADTIAGIHRAQQAGALVTGVVNVVGSTISRITEAGVYNHIGPEISVASTKNVLSQIVIALMHAILLGRRRGTVSAIQAQEFIKDIKELPGHIEKTLEQREVIQKIALKYANHRNMIYMGRKYNYPVAMEGALKIKELAYIHAEGLSSGEMKHGFIALVDETLPTVAIATKDFVYEKQISNIEEVRARHGPVIALASQGDQRIKSVADEVIYLPLVREELSPIINIIPLQLFAYYISVAKGLDVDKPRNLAKSVTVE